RPVFKSNYAADAATNVVGIAGDWGSTAWGFVEGISISISDQATLNDGGPPSNLWQRNMFAVRAEVEVGFAVRDANRFVKLSKGANAGSSALCRGRTVCLVKLNYRLTETGELDGIYESCLA